MKPKFTLGKTERCFLTKDYFSNGRYLIPRGILSQLGLSKILNRQLGSYHEGIDYPMTRGETPDMNSIIPQREGYKLLRDQPTGVKFKYGDEVQAYRFSEGSELSEFEIGVDPKYVPLLRLGHAHAKNASCPIIVLDSKDLNGELLAVIMPMRL